MMNLHPRNVDAVQTYRIKEIKHSAHRAYYGSKLHIYLHCVVLNNVYTEVEVEVKVFGVWIFNSGFCLFWLRQTRVLQN